jgi:hypothetical protein
LGDRDKAFARLQKSYDAQDDLLAPLIRSAFFDRLHSDPRYAALLKKLGLAEP